MLKCRLRRLTHTHSVILILLTIIILHIILLHLITLNIIILNTIVRIIVRITVRIIVIVIIIIVIIIIIIIITITVITITVIIAIIIINIIIIIIIILNIVLHYPTLSSHSPHTVWGLLPVIVFARWRCKWHCITAAWIRARNINVFSCKVVASRFLAAAAVRVILCSFAGGHPKLYWNGCIRVAMVNC